MKTITTKRDVKRIPVSQLEPGHIIAEGIVSHVERHGGLGRHPSVTIATVPLGKVECESFVQVYAKLEPEAIKDYVQTIESLRR